MKKILATIILGLLFSSAFANNPDNLSDIQIVNNLSVPITLNYSNGTWRGYTNPCIVGYPTNNPSQTIPAKGSKYIGSFYDVNTFMNIFEYCFDLENQGNPPAQFNLQIVVNDGQNPNYVINYFGPDANRPGDSWPSHYVHRQDVCNSQNSNAFCEPVLSGPEKTHCYPFSTLPGKGAKIYNSNYKVTLSLPFCDVKQSGNKNVLVFTVDYIIPPVTAITANIQNNTLQTLEASNYSGTGSYDKKPAAVPTGATNSSFIYTLPQNLTNESKIVQYNMPNNASIDTCYFGYTIANNTCAINVTSGVKNQSIKCSVPNVNTCTPTFTVDTIPNLTVSVNNASGKLITVTDPNGGGYYNGGNNNANNPFPVNGFTYTPPSFGTVNDSATVTYTSGFGACTYTYSYNGSTKVWTVQQPNNGGNTSIVCTTASLNNSAKGVATVQFNIANYVAPIIPLMTVNLNNTSKQTLTASYPGTAGKYSPAPPLSSIDPGNYTPSFTYKLPTTNNIDNETIVTYATSSGDNCTFAYSWANNTCVLTPQNSANNNSIICAGQSTAGSNGCTFNLTVNNLPKINANYVNNSIQKDITAAYTASTGTYSGPGVYTPSGQPLVPANFAYAVKVNNLADHGSVTYSSPAMGDSCVYDYYWDSTAGKCVVTPTTGSKNKWITCSFKNPSADGCTGDFQIDNSPNAPMTYAIQITNKMFTDLISSQDGKAIEDGQTVSIPIGGITNTTTNLVYNLGKVGALTLGCQFSVTWDANGKPTAITATSVGNGTNGKSKLMVNCVAPMLLGCSGVVCPISFSVGAPFNAGK